MPPQGCVLEICSLFGPDGDSGNWLDATQEFPNGVPRFETNAVV